MKTIKKPYKNALKAPFLILVACFRKKETVSGIIGNTQGVNRAIKPARKPSKNNPEYGDESESSINVFSKNFLFFKSNVNAAD